MDTLVSAVLVGLVGVFCVRTRACSAASALSSP